MLIKQEKNLVIADQVKFAVNNQFLIAGITLQTTDFKTVTLIFDCSPSF